MTTSRRKPFALANWKMSMTIAEGRAFMRDFQAQAGDALHNVEVVVCPPFTALRPLHETLAGGLLTLGGQDVSSSSDSARTGEISAALLADAGCRWVMLGHWEVRRFRGDDDATVNAKAHLASAAGLTPILMVGEGREAEGPVRTVLARQLGRLLDGCGMEEVGRMVFVYEPEKVIGAFAPAAAEQVAAGCAAIRDWLRDRYGELVAARARIIYGGSVAPENAGPLLACSDLDGLGATRRGRDAAAFAQIVRLIAQAKHDNGS